MRFDKTNGMKARYLVSIYGWNEDKYYFHYYKEAKAFYEKVKAAGLKKGYFLSIYDLITDERKAFARG